MTIDRAATDPTNSSLETDYDEKTGVSDSNEEPATPPSEKTEEEPEWTDLLGSGSVMKKIITQGSPNTRPDRRMKCVVNYELTLADGKLVERKDNVEIQLGDCDVVQGLDVAVGLMNVGEKCRLKIEPRLAFGTVGLSPKIPPNAKVVYDVELVAAEPEEDPESLSILERKLQGYAFKFKFKFRHCVFYI